MWAAQLAKDKEYKYGLIGLCCISLLGVAINSIPLIILPLVLTFLFFGFQDVRIPFYTLFGCIPISWEQELGNGFGTDLPTEPLMVLLMGLTFLIMITKQRYISARALLHPISLMVLLLLGWTWASSIWSQDIFVSIKFSLAKTWYVTVFFFLCILMLRSQLAIRRLFQIIILTLTAVTLIILIKHAAKDFSFESANFVMAPFFRNHVTSAALMSLMVPMSVFFILHTRQFLKRSVWVFCFVILVLGAYFSYTRAAHISLIAAVLMMPIVKLKWTKYVIIIGMIGMTFFIQNLVSNNKFLGLAPDFETTVSHSTFDDLVNATYQGKDISTMERLYRWVAGFRMVHEKPMLGFGPGNFYNYYKRYTLTLFKTYVSENPEKSGVHCYYLMTIIEQGILGLIILLGVIIVTLIYMENIYHRLEDPWDKSLMMTILIGFSIVILFQLINDLIETDKMGPFFFLFMAITVLLDLKSRRISSVLDSGSDIGGRQRAKNG